MAIYWITFEDGTEGCVETVAGEDVDAIAAEATGKAVNDVRTLPHPAEPRLRVVEHERYGRSPSFCDAPQDCAGRTSCPQSYACTE